MNLLILQYDTTRPFFRTFGTRAAVHLSAPTAATMGESVGFIGLGIMGEGMALRLLGAGRSLAVWNRSAAKADALKQVHPGAVSVCASPAEVVGACRVTYCMLSTPDAVKAVYEMEGGVLAGVAPGKRIVDCATIAAADMQRLSAQVVAKGGRFLEAPVSGSKGPAHAGSLIFLCAGDEPLYAEIAADLGAMGKAAHFFGAAGAGARMLPKHTGWGGELPQPSTASHRLPQPFRQARG